jgi:hypothetical protein
LKPKDLPNSLCQIENKEIEPAEYCGVLSASQFRTEQQYSRAILDLYCLNKTVGFSKSLKTVIVNGICPRIKFIFLNLQHNNDSLYLKQYPCTILEPPHPAQSSKFFCKFITLADMIIVPQIFVLTKQKNTNKQAHEVTRDLGMYSWRIPSSHEAGNVSHICISSFNNIEAGRTLHHTKQHTIL